MSVHGYVNTDSEDQEGMDTVAYLFDFNVHYEKEHGLLPVTNKLEDIVSTWEPPLRIESHPELAAKLETHAIDYNGEDNTAGFSAVRELITRREAEERVEKAEFAAARAKEIEILELIEERIQLAKKLKQDAENEKQEKYHEGKYAELHDLLFELDYEQKSGEV